jgi:hypothetical protein
MKRPAKHHETDSGAIAALVAIAMIPLILGLAIVVDAGRVWTARTALQNAVEVTVASAASTWIRTGAICPPSVVNYLSADDAEPRDYSCRTTGTSRDGTITVEASDETLLQFTELFRRSSAAISASTTARIGSASSLLGVWPIALCEFHPALLAWRESVFTLATPYTITLQSGPNNCGESVSGNWGTLDFDGGSNSNSDIVRWVTDGYEEALDVGDEVSGSPGGLTSSIGIESQIGNPILIALFDRAVASGNNATYRISGFARAILVDAHLTGAAAQRSLTVQFETAIVDRASAGAGSGSDFGITTWAICAYDRKGNCQ